MNASDCLLKEAFGPIKVSGIPHQDHACPSAMAMGAAEIQVPSSDLAETSAPDLSSDSFMLFPKPNNHLQNVLLRLR